MPDFVCDDCGRLRYRRFDEIRKFGNIPLTVPEIEEAFANDGVKGA
jgi:hypothetical protein